VIRRSTAALLLGTLLALAGCGSRNDHGGTIIYSSSIGKANTLDLYAAAADGSSRRRLTNTPDQCELNPVLTPDQRSFYFYRFACLPGKDTDLSHLELWRMDIDGSNEIRIAFGAYNHLFPSPDGTHIAMVDRTGALWLRRLDKHRPSVSPADKGERVELPRSASIAPAGVSVAWSHDGSRLVFPADILPDSSSPLFSLDLRTLKVRRLTSPPRWESDLAPRFSPDDRYVAYARLNISFYGVRLLDTKTGHTIEIAVGNEKKLPMLGDVPWFFSSDGSSLVYRALNLVYDNATSAVGVYSLARHEQRVIGIPPSLFLPQTSPDHTGALLVSPHSAGSHVAALNVFLVATDLCEKRMTRLGRLRVSARINDLETTQTGPLAVWAQPGPSSSRPAGHCELAKLLG